MKSRTAGGVVSLTQNRNVNRPARAPGGRVEDEVVLRPAGAAIAPTTGYAVDAPTYGLIVRRQAGVADETVLVAGEDDPRRDA